MPRIFTVLLIILSMASAAARTADVKFRSLEARDGLSSNHVNDILRDSRGYMWFATASGLTRYDGYDMKVYHTVRGDSTSIQDNYVQSVQEMPDGRLVIEAGDRYSVYDPERETFRRFSLDDYLRDGLPDIPNVVLVDGDRVWITVRGHGLYVYAKDKLRRIDSPMLDARDLTGIISGPDGHMLAVSDAGDIFTIDGKTYAVRRVAHVPAGRPTATFYRLYADRRGRVWVFGSAGVDVFDPSRDYALETAAVPRWTDRPVNSVSEDADGRLWVGYDNSGLEVIERDGTSRLYTSDATDRTSLGNNSVKVIYNDSTGGMWVGSYKKGVSVYFPSENKFDSWLIGDINCITPVRDHPGRVWLGGDYAGLMQLDLTTGRTTSFPGNDGAESPRAIVTMATDAKGGLWYGTYNGGLYYRLGDHTRHITPDDGLANSNVWALKINSDGTLWIGTLGGGLQLYDPLTDRFTTLTPDNSGLPSLFIHTLDAGADGTLYVGTPHGISVLDPHSRRASMLGASAGKDMLSMLSNTNINHLRQDSRGLLWIGTREGLDVYDTKADSMYHIELDPKFSSLFILGIIEGVDRSMWVSVDSRLFNVKVDYDRVARAYNFRTTGYDERDGLIGGTFNQRSMAVLPGGDILAGSLSGVTRIDPDRVDYAPSNRRISFTDLYVRGERIEVGRRYDGRELLPRALGYMSEVRLGPDQNDVAIYFANDNFSGTGATEYEYMLVGLDRDWQLCPRGSHSVRFAGLAPGRYALKVRALDSDGSASPAVAVLELVVDAPWYATWWAYAIYFLLVAGALITLIRLIQLRESRIFTEKQKQEQARKTEELNQLKFKFFTNISHELRTPLTLILSPVEAMLRETEDERNAKRLGVVKTNAEKLLILVNQLLDFRKNEMAGLTLHASRTDLVSTVRAVCDQFAGLTERRRVDIRFHSDCESLTMSLDSDKISKTVMNLLGNAVKYTPDGGSVDVSVQRRAGSAVITVADTGRGIPDSDKAHIFERFYRGTDKSDQNTGSGIGLSLVYEYVKLHGGSVDVHDNQPSGAVFTVSLPLTADDTAAEASAGAAPADEPARPSGPRRPTSRHVPPGRAGRRYSLSTTTATSPTSCATSLPRCMTCISHPTAWRLSTRCAPIRATSTSSSPT